MRRIVVLLTVLTVVVAACGDDGASPSTTTATPSTTGAETTTTDESTTSSASTTTAAPTTTVSPTTTTVPGTAPVDHTAYCVRGTASNDALNVRSGPGAGYDVVGELAWNAAGVAAGGLTAPDDQGRPWYLVSAATGLGWAAGWYLEPAPCTPATITVAPLAGPGWPDALAGSLVPWTWVNEDWALALYTTAWGGDFALYLLSPYGEVFEVFAWPWPEGPADPFDLYDWRPDGKAVLAGFHFPSVDKWEIRLLDLETRTSRTVVTDYVGIEGRASFTRPTGREVVVRTGDDLTERLEVRRTDGSLYSTLLEQPHPADWTRAATWLYGLDGTTVVVGDGTGLRLVSNQGDPIGDFDAPGVGCQPVRWWDDSTFLARCLPPEVLAYEPPSHYGRLWLVPADGGAATPLTALPPDPVFVGDYGFFDAWQVGDQVLANWGGDCGAAFVGAVQADGTTETITSSQMIGAVGSNLVVRRWSACDQSGAGLYLVGPDGSDGRDLIVPSTTETWGVIDALMLRDLP